MALTPTQIKANIDAMQKQGASNEDIQGWLDSLKGQVDAAPQAESGGFLKGAGNFIKETGKAVLDPFVNVGSTIEAKVLYPMIGQKAPERIERQSSQNLTEFAGNTLEAASYAIAPLKGAGGGFWGATKAMQPVAATLGAAEAMKTKGEGGSYGEAAIQGATTYAGVSAVAGLFGVGGDLLKNWGAKLMQNPAVQSSMQTLKNFADDTYAAIPGAFKPGVTLGDINDKNVIRTADALRKDFNQNFAIAKNNIIDAAVPTVNRPEVATAQFNHALSESMGKYFRESNALYDNVKADTTTVAKFSKAMDALRKAPSVPKIGAKVTADEMRAYTQASGQVSDVMKGFVDDMQGAIDQPLTLKQVMTLWDDALSRLPQATNEEKVLIREFASGLFADTKSNLSKTNPALLADWEAAWSRWGDASRLWESPLLNELKNPGRIENYIQKIASGKLTLPEQEVLVKTMADPAVAKSTQDLMVGSLLRTAKMQKPQEASKLINSFLDNFGDTFMEPEQRAMLGQMASFFDGNFDTFVAGMRNQLPGLADDTAGKLLNEQSAIDAFKVVEGKGLDQVTAQLGKIKDNPEFAKIVSAMSPDEKKALGLAVTKDFFDKNLPLATQLPDGTYEIEKSFADTILKTWDMIADNKTIQEVVGPEVVKKFRVAAKLAETLQDAAYISDASGMNRLYHAIAAAFYAQRGWIPGAMSNVMKFVAPGVQADVAGRAAKREAIDTLVENGLIKPGVTFTIGNVVEGILGRGAARITGANLNNE